jgi:hypothetical protein
MNMNILAPKNRAKVTLSLRLTIKYHAMKAYGGVDV